MDWNLIQFTTIYSLLGKRQNINRMYWQYVIPWIAKNWIKYLVKYESVSSIQTVFNVHKIFKLVKKEKLTNFLSSSYIKKKFSLMFIKTHILDKKSWTFTTILDVTFSLRFIYFSLFFECHSQLNDQQILVKKFIFSLNSSSTFRFTDFETKCLLKYRLICRDYDCLLLL